MTGILTIIFIAFFVGIGYTIRYVQDIIKEDKK
jgi:hypothetical protein